MMFSIITEKKEPDDGFEEDQQSLDEHGGMDDVQSLDVLLIPENTQKHICSKHLYTSCYFINTTRHTADILTYRNVLYI